MQQPSSRSRSDHLSLARLFKAGAANTYPLSVAERRLILQFGVNRRSATKTTMRLLSRLFKANGVKLSDDALEILDEAQFHRVRPFYTWILSSRFMAHRGLLKELVQFIPDRFQILTWVSQ